MGVQTIQSNIRNADSHASIMNYALFMGGTNVTHDVLEQYDPLKTGYSRIFMVRKPTWVDHYFSLGANGNAYNKFDMFYDAKTYDKLSKRKRGKENEKITLWNK